MRQAWPYNDIYFIRRCVAIWEQRGIHASITWTWPEGLACPEYSTAIRLFEQLTHDEHVWQLFYIWLFFMVMFLIPCMTLCCTMRTRHKVRCVFA